MKQYFAFRWHITDECDQRCKHCYIFSENNCKKPLSMTFEQMKEVIANIQDFCEVYSRLPYLYLTGGDPILHPDFWKLLKLLKAEQIPFTIMGNPFHLTEEVCRPLRTRNSKKWGIRTDYYAVMQLLLGYPKEEDNHPAPKARKNDRVLYVGGFEK